MKPPLVIYHHPCHDGITAAWVCRQEWPDCELLPANNDDALDIERLRGRDVVMVDIAWPLAVLLDAEEVVESLLIIDHHATRADDLRMFPARLGIKNYAHFDLNRSGAGLAWDVLFPGKPRPWLVDSVEDRDLWRFKLPHTREVHAFCNSFDLTIENRSRLMTGALVKGRDWFAERGESILRYHDRLIESAAQHTRREYFDGWNVPSLCCPCIELISDLGQKLAVGESLAMVWIPEADGRRRVSLRSAPDGVDVGKIAKRFGGGGHVHAAGFTTTLPPRYI